MCGLAPASVPCTAWSPTAMASTATVTDTSWGHGPHGSVVAVAKSASVNAAMATRTTQRPTRARADSASGSVSRMCGRLSGRGAESVPSVIFSLRRAPRAGP